jgi:20S proteasome alpha/beta subunit
MTVCIAATCTENDLEQCIVLCRDWRGELPNVGSSDEVYKLKRLSDKWVALIAGALSSADELCLRIEYSIKETPLTESNVLNQLRKILGGYKRALADSFLQNKYGFSFDDLIDKGKTAFGEAFVADCLVSCP